MSLSHSHVWKRDEQMRNTSLFTPQDAALIGKTRLTSTLNEYRWGWIFFFQNVSFSSKSEGSAYKKKKNHNTFGQQTIYLKLTEIIKKKKTNRVKTIVKLVFNNLTENKVTSVSVLVIK